ncbi:MAG: lysophospholipid acyltransferase family protein [Steroidobacteraceae bacterium]|nr:1-acyl-sn-glycerol-3-phosphate acyltransferase [Nevskiaceae bacterium]MCP5472832.1 1-acyl-sn-glycerol-3-phosphate acyltransferase [Nevskiaceae bacterium]
MEMTNHPSPPTPATSAAEDGTLTRTAYALRGVLAWAAFTLWALAALLLVAITPGLERRRRITHAAARRILPWIGVRLDVRGLGNLPAGPCVVVANHASYLDGVVMKAALPPRFAYVVKREMASVPLASLLLERIGTQFVERFDHHKGASDARRVLRSAHNGQALVFFPEGTFGNTPGLLKFHSGAFITAVRAGCPLVPAVIHGSRAVLPGTRLLPRPGRIVVEFLEPLPTAGEVTAPELRDRARALILERLGEPDLTA